MNQKTKTAYEAAVTMLSRHLMSEGELRSKLYDKKKWHSSEIEAAIQSLKKIAAVKDESLIIDYINSLKKRGYGPAKIKLELKKRRFQPELIEKNMSKTQEDDVFYDSLNDEDAARIALHRKEKIFLAESDPYKRRTKAMRYLMSRGFNGDTIRIVYEEWCRKINLPDGDDIP